MNLLHSRLIFLLSYSFVSADENMKQITLLKGIFNPQGSINIKGKTLVELDTGYSQFASKRVGWILSSDGNQSNFFTWDGDLTVIRFADKNEKRLTLYDAKNQIEENYYAVAWQTTEVNYLKKINRFIISGLPKEEQRQSEFGMFSMIRNRFQLADHVVLAANHAYFAHQLGHLKQANQCYQLALKGYQKYAKHYSVAYSDFPSELHLFVANRLASKKLNQLITSAYLGGSKQELLQQWEELSHIQFHKYRDEAKAKIKQYKSLIKEDSLWVEPTPEEIAKYSVEQQANYWLFHLRNHDASQISDPGTCNVFYIMPRLENRKLNVRVNAAEKLAELGIDAVPFIIKHLDDPRPTRSIGHWRNYWPVGQYLLAYGDCCQQIFERITKFNLYKGQYPIRDNAGKACKIKAEKWWLEHQKKLPKP